MADLTLGNVSPKPGYKKRKARIGTNFSEGQPGYLGPDGAAYPAIATGLTQAHAIGLALQSGNFQAGFATFVDFLYEGDLYIGAAGVLGQTYVVSAAVAGNIAPVSDLVSTNYTCVLGVMMANDTLRVKIIAGDTAHG